MTRSVLLALGLSWICLSLPAAQNTTARLVLEHTSVRAGDSTRVGVRLQMKEGWHTYWVNPGESGGATEVRWELPEGITVGELLWPVPELYVVAGMGTYVYHDEVLLMAPLRVSGSVRAGVYELKAKVEWLECAEVCLPGSATVSARFEVGDARVASADAGRFERWERRLPGREPPPGLRAGWEGPGEGNRRSFVIEWERRSEQVAPEFFALPGDRYDVAPQSESVEAEDDRVRLRLRLTRYGGAWPERVTGLVIERWEPEPMATEVILELGAKPPTAEVDEGG